MRLPLTCVGLMAVLVSASRAQDEPLKQALALEAAIVAAVEKAEASVACILVSRCEGYKRWDTQFGRREPGQLGDFRPPESHGGFRDAATQELLKRLNLVA